MGRLGLPPSIGRARGREVHSGNLCFHAAKWIGHDNCKIDRYIDRLLDDEKTGGQFVKMNETGESNRLEG